MDDLCLCFVLLSLRLQNAVLCGARSPRVFSGLLGSPSRMLVVFAALTYTAAPAISLGANNTVRYFFGSK